MKLGEKDWSLEDADTDIYSSNLHPYPAKFIPQIPDRMIKQFTDEGDKVLDPFNGSGNTTMMAAIRNREGYGCDLNPLSCMIARAKVRDYDVEKLNSHFYDFLSSIQKDMDKMKNTDIKKDGHTKEIQGKKVEIPSFPDKYDWFIPEIVNQIGLLNNRINQVEDKKLRCFYKVNMSAILKRVCRSQEDYTFIGDNMLPTSESNSLVPDNSNEDVLKHFKNKVEKNISRVEKTIEENPNIPDVRCGDFRKKTTLTDMDMAVTSPPYACAVDYARYHRLSFYWLNFPVKFTRDKEIGARSKRGRKNAVEDYLSEMKESYKKVYSLLNKKSYFVVVVGDSQRKKKKLKIPQKTLEMCKNIGFEHIESINREINNQSMSQKKIREEEIIILKKPKF